jgi:hypothetical protein
MHKDQRLLKALSFSAIKASVSKPASLLLPPVVKTVQVLSGDTSRRPLITQGLLSMQMGKNHMGNGIQ